MRLRNILYNVMIMEIIRDNPTRCSNSKCMHKNKSEPIVQFYNGEYYIYLCFTCADVLGDLVANTRHCIREEEYKKNHICTKCKFLNEHDGWDECTNDEGGVGHSRKGYANTTHSGKCKYFEAKE